MSEILNVLDVNSYNMQGMQANGGGEVNLQSKDITITENGTTTVRPDTGYDGLSDVDVTVATSGADLSEYFTDTISEGSTTANGFFKTLKKAPEFIITGTSASYMFYNCTNLEEISLLDTSNVATTYYMFGGCTLLKSIPLLNTSNVINMNSMFRNCSSLESIPLLNTSNVTDARYMFDGCTSLETIPLIDLSKTNQLAWMFRNCSSLISVPALTFGIAGGTEMFSGCTSLVDVPEFFGGGNQFTTNMFLNCPNLSNASLNNILSFFARTFTRAGADYKTLKRQGLSQTQADICVTLSNWQLCVDAGWTTGY